MKTIFVSYSSKHRDLTRQLVGAIELQYGPGSVWWDHDLESRASYSEQIKAALEQARVVVVVWTAGAMVSDYVYAEAARAQEQEKLVNVRPADMSFRDIPEPFNIHHIDDVADTAGIMATIEKVMTGTPIPTRVPLHEVYYRQHGRRLIDPKQYSLSRDPRNVSPTHLLQAKYGLVKYINIPGVEADLLAWCVSNSRRTAGCLLHGPGGTGKTRLLAEVAAELRSRGWTAGFLEQPHEHVDATLKQRWKALDQLVAQREDAGLLIVIDYAEGRRDEVVRIAERFSVHPGHQLRPLRVVLLARGAGEWWDKMYEESLDVQSIFRLDRSAPDVIALPPFPKGRYRLDLFNESIKAFSPAIAAQGYVLPEDKPSDDLSRRIQTGAGYARPLAIQMEALLWLASRTGQSDNTGVDGLLRGVLGMERFHWTKILGELSEERVRDISRGIAQVTLIQGISTLTNAERLLMADDYYQGQRTARVAVSQVLMDLSRLYGKSEGSINQLEPDLIGEHHVALVVDSQLIEGCLRWIETKPFDRRRLRYVDLLTVLQRSSQSEHGVKAIDRAVAMLDYLVSKHMQRLAPAIVAVAVDTPGALTGRLDRVHKSLDGESLDALDGALPHRSLRLAKLSAEIAKERMGRLLQTSLDNMTPEQDEAYQEELMNRGQTLADRWFFADEPLFAFATARLVVTDCIKWLLSGASGRGKFVPAWLRATDTMSRALCRMGLYELALKWSEMATNILSTTFSAVKDPFLSPYLAQGWLTHQENLLNLGRYDEAFAASQEAIQIVKRLHQSETAGWFPIFPRVLIGMATTLGKLGRPEEALVASEKAVEMFRQAVDVQPDQFVEDLVCSLEAMAIGLSDLERHHQALAVRQEVIELCRRLAVTRSEKFSLSVAKNLVDAGITLSKLERNTDALVEIEQALEMHRARKIRRLPWMPPVEAEHARALSGISDVLASLDSLPEAAQVAREAIILVGECMSNRPWEHRELARDVIEKVLRFGEQALVTPDADLLRYIEEKINLEKPPDEYPEELLQSMGIPVPRHRSGADS